MTLEETNYDKDAVQEELVAYLDGELSSEESAQVESRMAHDPQYRQQLQTLQKTWDLLDCLPTSEPSSDFTQSTVEIVALKAEKEAGKFGGTLLSRNSLFWGSLACASLVFGMVGYGIANHLQSAPNRQLVDDINVIDNVDRLQNVENLDFLESLAESGLFDE